MDRRPSRRADLRDPCRPALVIATTLGRRFGRRLRWSFRCAPTRVDLSSLEIEAHLTASVTVPGEVRALLRRLRGDLSATVYDNARLLASELATNAVRYGAAGAPIHVRAGLDDDCLRIQIRNDNGVNRPVVAAGNREHGGGWGLRLVDAIAQRWGSSESEGHTFVWFELEPASR